MMLNLNLIVYLNIFKLAIKLYFFKKNILIFKSLNKVRKMLYILKTKKKLIIKSTKLKLEKLIYAYSKLKSIIYIQNVFTIFSIKKELKVPKNSIL